MCQKPAEFITCRKVLWESDFQRNYLKMPIWNNTGALKSFNLHFPHRDHQDIKAFSPLCFFFFFVFLLMRNKFKICSSIEHSLSSGVNGWLVGRKEQEEEEKFIHMMIKQCKKPLLCYFCFETSAWEFIVTDLLDSSN